MRRAIIGLGAALLATSALAQVTEPVTAPPLVGPADPAADAARADAQARAAKAEQDRASDRAEAEQRQARREREDAEDRARDQKRQAEKEQRASEDRIAAEQRATVAANEKTRPVAAAPAAPQRAAPTRVNGDARSAAIDLCMAEARSRAAVHGVHVTLREVEDTDKMSDGRADVRASVNVVTKSSSGKTRTEKKTFKCQTRKGAVTKFKLS